MEQHKILIIEDEILIAEDLKDILESFGFKHIFLAHEKKEGIALIEKINPDVVLLDIRMNKEFDGLEIGGLIHNKFHIPFIYITAHSDINTIKEIVKTNPTGYITKPFKKSDLFANINLALSHKITIQSGQLKLKEGYETFLLNHSDINYIESDGNYVTIYGVQKKHLSRQSLESIYEELNSNLFFKTHRSYIVNLSKVKRYSKKDIILNDDVTIPLSRNLVNEFENCIKAFL